MDSKVSLQVRQGDDTERDEPDESQRTQTRGKYPYGSHATPIPVSGQA
jgi:hypothetical protein